ncbi:electron transfer flavoprotein subunit beta/FixA family protein [Candidatus Bathyarchaeota archaeon]|nr:electron transfer flavoprotein subunit beta/FixA family protein [Candidatus Bathyarchaeota archaeon]
MSKGLKIVVLVKQVPDIEKVRFDYEKGRLDRSSAEAVINPFDLNALEAAAQIKEKIGGVVTVVSMGPEQAEDALRDALARGADEAVLLSDLRFAGADTLATSYTLSCAVRKLGAFDLIVCGEKTIDGDTAQVGPEVAEFLGIPHVAYVNEILDVSIAEITVKSRLDKDNYVVKMCFPGLITVTKDANVPRLPTLKDKLRSRKAEIAIWGVGDLTSLDEKQFFGLQGSPTWVARVFAPTSGKKKGQIVEGTPEEKARKVAEILIKLGASQ